MPSNKKRAYLDALVEALLAAKEAANAASTSDDGGTCNFDTATLFPSMRLSEVDMAYLLDGSGVRLTKIKWMGVVCYWLDFGSFGQGSNQTRTSEAAQKVMKEYGHDCSVYYAID